jgi:CBS-domain-containing membrane protein
VAGPGRHEHRCGDRRETTSYKQVARLMTEHKINALPVVTKNDHVVGMVSEADVLRKEERRFRRLVSGLSGRARRERTKAEARTGAGLMTLAGDHDTPRCIPRVGRQADECSSHPAAACARCLGNADRHCEPT